MSLPLTSFLSLFWLLSFMLRVSGDLGLPSLRARQSKRSLEAHWGGVADYLLTSGLHCAMWWVGHCIWAPCHPHELPASFHFSSWCGYVLLGGTLGSVSLAVNIPGATWQRLLRLSCIGLYSFIQPTSSQCCKPWVQPCLASPSPGILWFHFSASQTLVFCHGWGEIVPRLHGAGRPCEAHGFPSKFSNSPAIGSTCTSIFQGPWCL